MVVVKVIVIIAITMALSIALAMKSIGEVEEKMPFAHTETSYDYPKELPIKEKKVLQLPSKRVISRFLAERNRNAADHCNKDEEICYVKEGTNYTCCNNKCVDLSTDKDNCGACKKKCKYTDECCGGECVEVAYDKRHCGSCNHPCKTGEYCFYGLCNYA